jgi:regulator of sirC expression with transglutaminase-like and TPR domain
MTSMSAVEEFLALVGGPEERIALDTGCLLIAALGRGGSDHARVVTEGRAGLDQLAARSDAADLDGLLRYLFGTVGFVGSRAQYDDPRNSYLDEVLERRCGIPITLAVVVIEVGRRLGLELAPVGMPGHFLVGAGEGRYVDAFDGGRVLDEDGCRRRFVELAGPGAPWSTELLAPVGPRSVLTRVLANLRRLFAASNDLHRLDWVLALRTGIPGVPSTERMERATVLAALGRFDEAAAELDRLADLEQDGSPAFHHPSQGPAADVVAAPELRARAARLRARLN